jgi:hypothetical protein
MSIEKALLAAVWDEPNDDLDANWIGEAGIAALVANPTLRSLRRLSLDSSDVTDAAVATLVGASWFPSLRGLHLGDNPFRVDGLRTLVAAARSGSLLHLGLRGSTVGGGHEKRFADATLALLFGSPHLAGLRQLDVGINHVGGLCSAFTILFFADRAMRGALERRDRTSAAGASDRAHGARGERAFAEERSVAP